MSSLTAIKPKITNYDNRKRFYGIGFNSRGKYKTRSNDKPAKEYVTWFCMIQRCYSPDSLLRQPTYIDCVVADEWLDYQVFAGWYSNHDYVNMGYELDKDILRPDNKIYSPETCCLVPSQINSLFTGKQSNAGNCPQGVSLFKRNGTYRASITIRGDVKNLGYYKTSDEAYQAYKTAKEAHVKTMALEWQDRIASNVFEALMAWELPQPLLTGFDEAKLVEGK